MVFVKSSSAETSSVILGSDSGKGGSCNGSVKNIPNKHLINNTNKLFQYNCNINSTPKFSKENQIRKRIEIGNEFFNNKIHTSFNKRKYIEKKIDDGDESNGSNKIDNSNILFVKSKIAHKDIDIVNKINGNGDVENNYPINVKNNYGGDDYKTENIKNDCFEGENFNSKTEKKEIINTKRK